MFKQSISVTAMTCAIALSAIAVDAREVEVKAGNVRVSVQNSQVEVDNGSSEITARSAFRGDLETTRTKIKTPSLFERLTGLRLFNGSPSRTSTRSQAKCDRSSYSTSSHQTSRSGVSQSSSSTTTMMCQ